MTTIDADAALKGLEADGAWLHRLARSLCRDPEQAADAAQETLVLALERAPQGGPRRPWLARVLRNRLVQDWRSEERRTAREAGRAEDEGPSTADAVLERIELQERVAAAVRSLDEPFRTAIVLRFFDGQPPRRIAVRTGVPVKTVKSRLVRGLALLRGRLDREFGGDRTRWTAALLALPAGTWTPGILAGASAMGLGTKVVSGAALVAAVWFGVTHWGPGSEDPELRIAQPESRAEETLVTAGESEAVLTPDVESRSSADDGTSPVGTPSVSWGGRVVDLEGRPLEGVPVGLRRERAEEGAWVLEPVPSAEDGIFTWDIADAPEDKRWDPFLPTPAGTAWAPVRSEVLRSEVLRSERGLDAGPPLLTVAPARNLALRVVDQVGTPLAGVALEVEVPPGLARALDNGREAGAAPRWSGASDAAGLCAFEVLPSVDGLRILARLEGYAPLEATCDAATPRELTLELQALQAGASVVAGHVFGPDGLPYEGALVSVGGASMRSETSGWFAVPIPPEDERFRSWTPVVRAVAEGFLPGEASLDRADPTALVELHLAGTPRTVRGRVLGLDPADWEQSFRSRVTVWANGVTEFGLAPFEDGSGGFRERFAFVEELVAGKRGPLGPASTYVAADGTFTLSGLRPVPYTIHAFDSRTLRLADPVVLEPDAREIDLVLVSDPPPLSVRGRVVDLRGQPVSRAVVSAGRDLDVDAFTVPGGPSARTDEEGRFAFEGLCFDRLELYVRGHEDEVSDRGFWFTPDQATGELQLTVYRACRLQIETEDALLASAEYWIVDAAGDALSLQQVNGTTRTYSGSFRLAEGQSGVLWTDESARELVLRPEEGELLRVPIELSPEEITRVAVR